MATALGVSVRTVRKWWARYRAEGLSGLADRSSRPLVSPRRTAAATMLGIKVLRLQQWTCAEIAGAVGVSAATPRASSAAPDSHGGGRSKRP